MSIRQGLLALLEQGPMYGYQLRAEFEQRTGATWPLNVGQVYTTLTRLERDGLVEAARAPTARATSVYRDHRRRPGRGGDLVHHAGRPARQPPRDELAIKLALAVTVPGVDVGHGHPAAAHGHDAARCRTTPGSSERRAADAGRAAPTWPGAGPRLPGLRGRGRDPLARPLRGPAARARSSATAPRRRRRADVATGRRRQRRTPRSACPMTAVLELDDVTRVHGEGETEVHALRGVSFAASRRRAGRGDGSVRAPASRPCSPWPAGSTRPTSGDGAASRAPTWPALGAQGPARGCGVRRSATSSRTST